MATVSGSNVALSGSTLAARAGPRVVHFGRLITWGGTGTAGTAVAYAKAVDGSSGPAPSAQWQRQWEAYQEWDASQRDQPRTEQLYLFWADAPETNQ